MARSNSRLIAVSLCVIFWTVAGHAATTFPVRAGAAHNQTVNLPAAFIPNRGQTDSRVQFVTQTRGARFWFTRDEAVVALRKGGQRADLALRFIGANPDVIVRGSERMQGTVNYLIGNDRSRWQTDLPTYRELVYSDLWPGIDLVFRDEEGTLKYEFHVAAGADLSAIRMQYRGAQSVQRGTSGELVIATAAGTITDAAPVTYQVVKEKRVQVASNFVVGEDGRFGFAVETYEADQPLVVDPGLAYSTYLGGSGEDQVGVIAVDTSGNAYVAGYTASVNFPIVGGGLTAPGTSSFVTKLNPSGTSVIWSTYFGGSDSRDFPTDIAVNSSGSVFMAGVTYSPDFPTTAGAYDTTFNGNSDHSDAYVVRLQPSGNGLIYSTYLGGIDGDYATGMAVDASDNVYVTGWPYRFYGPSLLPPSYDFPVTAGAFNTTAGTAYLTKFSASGSLVYSTHLGFSFLPSGVAVDSSGNAYLHGTAYEGFAATPGAYATVMKGFKDIAVMKVNATASQLSYATLIPASPIPCQPICLPGPQEGDVSRGIEVDSAGNAYITGIVTAPDFPTTPGAHGIIAGYGFVTKINAAGSALVYSAGIGGQGFGIALDAFGRAFVTGLAVPAFPPTIIPALSLTIDAFDTTASGGESFLLVFDPTGTSVEFASFLGGSGYDIAQTIALDSAGDVYIGGLTDSSDFPTTSGAFDTTFNGGVWDGFVTKIDFQLPAPFQSFAANASTGGNSFEIKGTFTLAAGSDGISPLTEEVRLEVGTATYVMPAGSFKLDKKGRFKFESRALEMVIEPLAGRTYSVKADGRGQPAGDSARVFLSIGNDRGTATSP